MLVDEAPVLLWSTGPGGDEGAKNQAWATFSGRSLDALKGDAWQQLVHPEDLERCLGIRAASFEAATAFSLDVRLRRHDGAYRWMLDNGAPRATGGDGHAKGFVGALVDIHERKELEETLARRAQQLRLAERRQGKFLAMLSHELRNPLAPIANAASVLGTLAHTNPILGRLREILDRQVGRLSHLISELIDVTRAAQGQISLVRAEVSVESIVQAAVVASEDKVAAGGHRVHQVLPDERLFVRGDSARLAQALAQLIGNAAKFSLEPGDIRVAVRRVARTVQIAVTDHGQGLDAGFLPQAFELFAQQDPALSRGAGGLGVGLTLARRVAQLHGGDVEGFSDGPGQGAEFVMWMPLVEAAPAAAHAVAQGLDHRLRVLVVEANPAGRDSLRQQMQLWGTEVSTARDAAEAAAAAYPVAQDIVLCDVGVASTRGFELVHHFRGAAGGARALFVAVSSDASDDNSKRALAAGTAAEVRVLVGAAS